MGRTGSGRAKGLVIRGGDNVDPKGIEDALGAHPAVHLCAAVGAPEAYAGELPVAYAKPNPTDRSSPGVFWINGLPDRAPTYGLPSITLHEAWPGHLMHIALMQEMDQLPMFRRANFTKYTACLEGWAMYCEWLGVELSLYGTPH